MPTAKYDAAPGNTAIGRLEAVDRALDMGGDISTDSFGNKTLQLYATNGPPCCCATALSEDLVARNRPLPTAGRRAVTPRRGCAEPDASSAGAATSHAPPRGATISRRGNRHCDTKDHSLSPPCVPGVASVRMLPALSSSSHSSERVLSDIALAPGPRHDLEMPSTQNGDKRRESQSAGRTVVPQDLSSGVLTMRPGIFQPSVPSHPVQEQQAGPHTRAWNRWNLSDEQMTQKWGTVLRAIQPNTADAHAALFSCSLKQRPRSPRHIHRGESPQLREPAPSPSSHASPRLHFQPLSARALLHDTSSNGFQQGSKSGASVN
jgi:hypothetical protein